MELARTDIADNSVETGPIRGLGADAFGATVEKLIMFPTQTRREGNRDTVRYDRRVSSVEERWSSLETASELRFSDVSTFGIAHTALARLPSRRWRSGGLFDWHPDSRVQIGFETRRLPANLVAVEPRFLEGSADLRAYGGKREASCTVHGGKRGIQQAAQVKQRLRVRSVVYLSVLEIP